MMKNMLSKNDDVSGMPDSPPLFGNGRRKWCLSKEEQAEHEVGRHGGSGVGSMMVGMAGKGSSRQKAWQAGRGRATF